MSVAEIIAMIQKLSVEEQEQVRAYLDQPTKTSGGNAVRRMDTKAAMALGEETFDQHPELFRKLAQ